jgi:hypothetical protein
MAKNSENQQSKSLKPEGLEDKSLAPQELEDKAVEAEPKLTPPTPPKPEPVVSDSRVEVVVAHPISAGRIGNDKALRPGQTTSVTRALATSLIQQGVARLA